MLCNLPPPSADGSPALLFHSDVVTFFHEFGHIMHGLCAEGEGNGTTYAKCPRDFVEGKLLNFWRNEGGLPSKTATQMLHYAQNVC